MPGSRGNIWESFRKNSDHTATCMLCNKIYSYKDNTSSSNLFKHLNLKHRSIRSPMDRQRTGRNRDTVSPFDEDRTAVAELQTADADDDTALNSPRRRPLPRTIANRRKISAIWKFFDALDSDRAQCMQCASKLSYKGGCTSNLRKHLVHKHSGLSQINVKTVQQINVSKKFQPRPNPNRRKVSIVWQYFDALDADRAQCMQCTSTLSYKGGCTSNLRKHLDHKHGGLPTIDEESEQPIDASEKQPLAKREIDDDDDDSDAGDSADRVAPDAPAEENYDIFVSELDAAIETVETQSDNGLDTWSEYESLIELHEDKLKPSQEDNVKLSQADALQAPNTRRKSIVWKFFSIMENPNYVICRLCSRILARKDCSTSNLRKHLFSKHKTEMQPAESDVDNADGDVGTDDRDDDMDIGPPLEEVNLPDADCHSPILDSVNCARLTTKKATTTSTAAHVRPSMRRKTANHLQKPLEDLLSDDFPSIGFVAALQSADTRAHITAQYQALVKRVTLLLQQADFVALTAATWSSNDHPNDTYLAITAHFITRTDWRLHGVLLNCVRCSASGSDTDPPSSDRIASHLRHTCDRWRIADKVFAIVHAPDDEHSDWVETAAPGWSRMQCLDQRLSVCIGLGLEVNEFECLRLQIKSIVQLFATDSDAADKFVYFQRQSGAAGPPLRLDDDVWTRWRSTMRMMQRLCTLQEPLDASLELLQHDTRLSIGDWMAIRDVRGMLQSIDVAIAELRSSAELSTSKAIVLLHGLNAQLAAHRCSPYRSVTSKEMAGLVQRTVRTGMPDTECDLLLAVCTFLDPRFKRLGFVQHRAYNICRVHVETLAGQVRLAPDGSGGAPSEGGSTSSDPESVWHWLDQQVSAQQRDVIAGDVLAGREMQFFMDQPTIGRHEDPLQWWRCSGRVSCPRLAQVARKYLALPATCAASRRALATAQRLLRTGAGGTMDGTLLKQVVFLRENSGYLA